MAITKSKSRKHSRNTRNTKNNNSKNVSMKIRIMKYN
jgi:hypothetical protein